MRRIITFIIFLILSANVLFAEVLTVERAGSALREGPSTIFPLIAELSNGARVELISEENGWCKVIFNKQTGYIAHRAFQKTDQKSSLASLQGDASVSSSKHAVSAGIKGFAGKFGTKLKSDTLFYHHYFNYSLNYNSYKEFYGFSAMGKRYGQDTYQTSNEEKGMGLSMASKVASTYGLFDNNEWNDLVRNVGQYLISRTTCYDIEFKFFIINVEEANAYAFPGGIVFITKGMLVRLENEDELACVLAHEIIHVLKKHGMQEINKRKPQISADKTFNELDEEVYNRFGDEPDEVEAELDELSLEIYETIFQGRLDDYEKEADIEGIKLATTAGYQPQSLKTLLLRIASQKSNNQHYRGEIIEKRINWINADNFPNPIGSRSDHLRRVKSLYPLK